MEGLLLPEQDKKLSDFETGTTQISVTHNSILQASLFIPPMES